MVLIPSNLRGKIPLEAATAIEQLQESVRNLAAQLNQTNAQVTNTQTNQTSLAATVDQALSTLPASSLLSAGSSSGLKAQGNAVPTVNGKFAYVSTTSSITWYWDGTNGSSLLTIYWPDGTSTAVPPANLAITGLSSNTAYTFYPYFNVDLNSVGFVQVSGGVGTPAAAYTASSLAAAAAQSADGNTPMVAAPLTASTTSSGSGGGSGGGNGGACVAEFILVEPLSLRSEIICSYMDASEWVDVQTAHRRLVAVPNHLVYTDQCKMRVKELAVGFDIITRDGLERITKLRSFLQRARKKQVFCRKGHLYWANGVLSHNGKTF